MHKEINQNQITMQVVLALLEVTKTLGTVASTEQLNYTIRQKAEGTISTILDIINFEMDDLRRAQGEAKGEPKIHRL